MTTEIETRLALLEQRIDHCQQMISKDFQLLKHSIIIWYGSMQIVTLGFFYVAYKLT